MPARTLSFEGALHDCRPRSFSTLIKPVGARCNLHCTYCYYNGGCGTMDPSLLETCIRQYIEAQENDTVTFCWHGGEPTLAGLEFYRKALELQQRYQGDKRITNTLQTNGTRIDAEWARFFAQNHFLIGISLDGPKDVHNRYRQDFEQVMQSIRLFHEYGVDFNTLSVVHRGCENRGLEIYQFLRDEVRSQFLQFIPTMNWGDWQVSAQGYGHFLTDIFFEWYHRDIGSCFVQLFEATLARWCGRPSGICSMDPTCGNSLVVEPNGDIYTCDHFVGPEHQLGNLQTTSLEALYEGPERHLFGNRKQSQLPHTCRQCPYLFACQGGCPKQRWDRLPDGSYRNYLCEGLQHYFSTVAPYMDALKKSLHL